MIMTMTTTTMATDKATVDITAVFNDLGTLDTHTATIDWGDGTPLTDGVVSETPFAPGSTAGANGTVTGTHTYEAAGEYTVTVTVVDDNGGFHSDTLKVTVKKPTESKHFNARGDEYKLNEDTVLQVDAADGVLDNDRGPAGAPLEARLVEGPDHGSLVFNTDGSFTYTPDADFNGKDWFWYEFTDGVNVSEAVKVQLKIKAVYDPPAACIDWHANAGDGWGAGYSPFGSGAASGQSNFSDFLMKLIG
jgi:Big-like domain-containing protein/PKD domain-containing protein